jgi:hypothetical protein
MRRRACATIGGMAVDDPHQGAKESLSQFLARVFDQLTITSWLPALMLVAITLILAQLARANGSLQEAFKAIGAMSAIAVVLLVASVVIGAMFTQAFEFEAIRAVEGYWPERGPLGRLTRRRRQKKLKERDALIEQLTEVRRRALASARPTLRKRAELRKSAFRALEAYVLGVPQAKGTKKKHRVQARAMVEQWPEHADSALIIEIRDVERRINEYPSQTHRVLPTHLGNVVRAVEDRVHDPRHGRLENFVIHVYDELPSAIAAAFREQRRRLDLYCGLVFVFALAVVPAIAVSASFESEHVWTGIAVPASLTLLSLLSYRAAVASGRKFGLALTAIKEYKDRAARTPTSTAVAPAQPSTRAREDT